MNKYLKFLIPALLALAIGLGLLQRKNLPDFSFGSRTSVAHFSDASDKSLADYYQTAQQLLQNSGGAGSRFAGQTSTTTFLAVGDIMLSRNVAAATLNSSIKEGVDDSDFPFRNDADTLKSTDFNFGNLESPFGTKTGGAIIGGHSLIFGAADNSVGALKNYNFKILNLANNHAFDQGLTGLNFTKKLLSDNGIQNEGTGNNLDQAWTPAIITSNGIKICFVGASFSSINDGGKTSNNYVARIEDLDRLKSSILNLKSTCDFVVVTMHAGTEYTRTPNEAQTDFAHTAIDDGADIVIGAHPHWVQTVEKYKNKYIFYSLGNFIFDQNFSQDTKEGLTLKMTISKAACHPEGVQPTEGSLNAGQLTNLRDSSAALGMTQTAACIDDLQGNRIAAKLTSIELIPVIINNSQPRPAKTDEAKKILQKIGENQNILK